MAYLQFTLRVDQHDQWISEVRAANLGHAPPPDPASDGRGLSRVDGCLVLTPYA
ncbi:hypothetical protein ACWD4G_05375 [Streptomyces sp. NPDC002643]